MTKTVKCRPKIGLISDSCIESYNARIWDGVIEGVQECGVDLYCFMGGAIKSPFSFFSKSNVIYDLISHKTLDGLIINSGSLGNFIDKEEYLEFLSRFTSIPCVNIGGEIPGMSGIVVDNAKGMRELVTHLLEVHGYRKIAFIRGPEGIKDADIRFDTYREVIAEYGIAFDPDLVFEGDFMSPSGKKAVTQLIERTNGNVDAIVAANDVMAIEAINQLEKRGFDVPEDIAVAGFDDREASRYLSNPLTTVEQPIAEIGRVAVLLLVAKLKKERVKKTTLLPTRAIIRNSCGCTASSVRQKEIAGKKPGAKRKSARPENERLIDDLIALVKPEFVRQSMTEELRAQLNGLTGKLHDNLKDAASRTFIKELERVVIFGMQKSVDVQSFNEVIYELLGRVSASLADSGSIALLNALYKDALILVRDLHMRHIGHSILTENNQTLRLHWINKRLISVFSLDTLRELIVDEFHHLGIKSTYLSLYVDPNGDRTLVKFIAGFEYYPFEVTDSTPTIEDEEIELRHSFDPLSVPEQDQVYPAQDLIPVFMAPIEERKSFIVLPLFFQDEQLGFVIFEIGPRNGNIYETLAIQLSSAFMSIQLFNQVEQYTMQLEKKVEERTSHLHDLNEQLLEEMKEKQILQSQFLQAQKMEAIGRLAGGIAHDFNNIIATILGYSEYLLEDPDTRGEFRESIQEVMNSSLRAKSLIKQLLAFSHKQVLKPEEIDLNKLLQNMEKMLKRLIGENISIHSVLDLNSKPVMADPGQLEQVVMNLIVNSRDALPKGGKIIIRTKSIKVLPDDMHLVHRIAPGAYTQLIVTDNGIGMDRETIQKIFEPFFTTKERGKGTGLGLSTVFGIIKQSEGCIDVESEPGKGTSFIIYLPAVTVTAGKTLHGESATDVPTGTETVLLVEDDEEFGRVAAKMLKRAGYTVHSAVSGDEALRVLSEKLNGRIDLIITDVIMPKMSGRELAERVFVLYPDMKILYISGYTGSEIHTQGVLEKSNTFLQKPFSSSELARKVREILDTKTESRPHN